MLNPCYIHVEQEMGGRNENLYEMDKYPVMQALSEKMGVNLQTVHCKSAPIYPEIFCFDQTGL